MMKRQAQQILRSVVIVALIAPVIVAGASIPANSQTGDASFTGGIFDSFGAQVEATAGLAFDPYFAYVQSVALEQTPLATAHGYGAFPGAVAANTVVTCCGASPDYPRYGGQLPTETICGDPGNLKRGEPEVRNPRNYGPTSPTQVGGVTIAPGQPATTYNTNCAPGSPGCDIIRRGNPVSSEERQEFASVLQNRATFSSGYGLSECDSQKGYAFSDERSQGVSVIPVGTSSASKQGSSSPVAPPQIPVPQPEGGLVSPPGTKVLPAVSKTAATPQQTTVYAISMGSVTSFGKVEILGPGFVGAPATDAESASPSLATTGGFTDRVALWGLLALAASVVSWGVSRRIGLGRYMSLVAATVILASTIFGFAPRAESAEQLRIVGTVISRANDVVISAGTTELFRVAEVSVIARVEANGQPGGATTSVTRTVRGVKVLGQDQADLNQDKINSELGSSGLSFRLGEVKREAQSDGSEASIDATGLFLEQKIPQTVIGGVQFPEYRLTLARATPSVSFFSLASLIGGVDFGTGLTQSFSGTEGEASGGGTTVGGTFSTPQNTSVPGVKQIGPGKYVLQGKFAGFDFQGMKVKLWSLKDITEAAGGILLIIAVVLAARHRRKFAAAKPG